jgi:hypothetical protein
MPSSDRAGDDPGSAMKSLRQQLVGNCFLHPAWDYLLIGSLWSIALTLYWLADSARDPYLNPDQWVWLVLLANSPPT